MVRGRDQTERRDLGGVAADRGIHLVFDGPEQFYLEMNGQFADLVKEQRAVVGRAYIAFLVGVRSGEGPFGVPEEFAFEKLLGMAPQLTGT